MTFTPSSVFLERASRFVGEQMGLHYPPSRWQDLERCLGGVAHELGVEDSEGGWERLIEGKPSPREMEIFAHHLTIGETFFFREPAVFDALRSHVLPERLKAIEQAGRRNLRVWSAGCCTGEEPYSIAMLLEDELPDIDSWNLSILATDLNARFLQHAASGMYKKWSFRDESSNPRQRFFQSQPDGRWELIPRIRRRVNFASLNLATDPYPSLVNGTCSLDLIFCRNVLMYFSPQRMREIIDRFYECLVDGGWLIVSSTEVSHQLFSQFHAVHLPNVVLYQKLLASAPANKSKRDSSPSLVEMTNSNSLRPRTFSRRAVRRARDTSPKIQSHTPAPPPIPLLDQARRAANTGHLEEALAICDGMVERYKMNPSFHYLRATILEELGSFSEAESALKRALYLNPEYILVYFALGNLALRQQKTTQARKHFDTVLRLLERHQTDEELTEADGLTVGRLAEIVRSLGIVA